MVRWRRLKEQVSQVVCTYLFVLLYVVWLINILNMYSIVFYSLCFSADHLLTVIFLCPVFERSNIIYMYLFAGAPPGAARPGRPPGGSDPDVHQCHEQSER